MEYALAAAGIISRYFVAKLPLLRQQLGPVAAANSRLASRIANTLRAGTPQRNFSGLGESRLILLCAPGGQVETLLPGLLESSVEWHRKILVLCDCGAYSRELMGLRERGAFVSSLNFVPGTESQYVVEGDRAAVRAAKQIVREVRGSSIELRADGTDLYSAALTISSSLFTPLLESCTRSLRAAGADGQHPAQLSEALFRHTLRAFMYSGSRSWTGAIPEQKSQQIQSELNALKSFDQDLATVYRSGVEGAVALLGATRKKPGKA